MLSAWKFNENIEKLDMNSNDFESKVADYKYSYDKLFIVTREVAEYYGNRFGSDVKEYILNSIKQEREGNAFRVNTLSEILSQKDNIPDEEFKKLVEAAKKGQREFEGENLFEKYQISQETPEFISLETSNNEGFIRMDFGLTEWDNSELSSMASILRDVYKTQRLPNFFKSIKENLKKIKEGYGKLFSNNEPLKELGPGEDKTVLPNKSENFVSLTPEAMQKFRRGEKEVLQAHRETEIKIAENPEINKKNNPEIDAQEL